MLTASSAIGAGQTVKFTDLGNFFRVLKTTDEITIRTYRQGAVLSEAVGVTDGFAEEFDTNFDAVEIYSATAQTVQVAIRLGAKVYYDKAPVGDVQVLNKDAVNGAFVQGRASVTNANQAIIAANAARRFLMIQNNDTSQTLRVTLSGVAATAAQGFRIGPGDSLDLSGYQSTAAINAIMEAATGAVGNVEFAEG